MCAGAQFTREFIQGGAAVQGAGMQAWGAGAQVRRVQGCRGASLADQARPIQMFPMPIMLNLQQRSHGQLTIS